MGCSKATNVNYGAWNIGERRGDDPGWDRRVDGSWENDSDCAIEVDDYKGGTYNGSSCAALEDR